MSRALAGGGFVDKGPQHLTSNRRKSIHRRHHGAPQCQSVDLQEFRPSARCKPNSRNREKNQVGCNEAVTQCEKPDLHDPRSRGFAQKERSSW
ncbi:hypothetical protein Zmor_010445 [Zophobas morio]|uniref:Uncharacterized protein n=1 Tax=Zophobas morio TaxID=2755281 RepID=A0AA38IRV7_9CUCU|nr:hypothetical protein Zmor_010445 [Zophobas morio]